MTILAIDVGTTNVKAVIFDAQGNALEMAKIPLGPYRADQPSWSEQDPDHFWKIVCQACQLLKKKGSVQGIALTTQRATVVNVDKQGKPLRPAITWMDNRRTENLPPVGGIWGLLFSITGLSKAIANIQAQAEANWIKTFQPEIWNATHKFLLLSGYLTFRFTGAFVDSVGCQVGYLPFDFKHQTWAKKSDWKWKAIPMMADLLPELVPCGQVIGTLTREAAHQTGLTEGLPLIAAAADKACEVLGSGCIDPSVVSLSCGTAATVNISSQKYKELFHYLPPYPAAFPGGYNNEVQIYKGFAMVDWFSEEFGVPRDKLENLVKDRVPGDLGLILEPFWLPGLKLSESNARGAIIGFREYHHKQHLYQAILEGLIYRLREGMETIQKYTRTPITRVMVSGGGSQSDAVMQIAADIFGQPASRPHLYETASLGAAINAAVGCRIHPDHIAAVQAMTRIGKTFEPNPQAHTTYDELYRRVYKKMLKKLAPLYAEIENILSKHLK